MNDIKKNYKQNKNKNKKKKKSLNCTKTQRTQTGILFLCYIQTLNYKKKDDI